MSDATNSSSRRLDSLDGLRGVAALAVAWFHIFQKSGEQVFKSETLRLVLDTTSAYGWLGVPAFFVMTGFIIPYATFRNPATAQNTGVFLKKRFLRLYPPFVATIAVALAISFGALFVPGFNGELPTALTIEFVMTNLLLVTPFFGDPWLVPVFWSLLVEVQYYLVIACVLFVSARWHGPDLSVPLCLLTVGLALFLPYSLHAITSFGPLFVIGHALYRHHAGIGRTWENYGLVVVAFFGIGFATSWLYLAPTALSIAVIRWSPPPGRALLFLGTISFSLYLTHYFIGTRAVRLIERFVWGDWGHVVAYLGATVIAIIAAWLFYQVVEKPSLRWSARVRYQKSSELQGAAPVPTVTIGDQTR